MLTKAIESIDWRRYGLEQTGGKGVPKGPAAILVHLASNNVQFTSEAKEAVSDNEEVFDGGCAGHYSKLAGAYKATGNV